MTRCILYFVLALLGSGCTSTLDRSIDNLNRQVDELNAQVLGPQKRLSTLLGQEGNLTAKFHPLGTALLKKRFSLEAYETPARKKQEYLLLVAPETLQERQKELATATKRELQRRRTEIRALQKRANELKSKLERVRKQRRKAQRQLRKLYPRIEELMNRFHALPAI